MAQKVIVAYIPVIHLGYLRLFEENPAYHHELLLINEDIVNKDRTLQRDIRRLHARLTAQALRAWNRFDKITVADVATLQAIPSDTAILMPDEDISHQLAEAYFTKHKVTFYPTFLRWDRRKSQQTLEVDPDLTVTSDEAQKMFLTEAQREGFKSQDIWRRVGALLVKDGDIVSRGHNESRPEPYSSWIAGDPRNNYQQGSDVDKSIFQHAESCAIADAARQGIATEGADMYVTTFPCPQCAMFIAYSGIKRLFFAEGYAALSGLETLRAKGVKVIKVNTELPQDNPAAYIPYPEK